MIHVFYSVIYNYFLWVSSYLQWLLNPINSALFDPGGSSNSLPAPMFWIPEWKTQACMHAHTRSLYILICLKQLKAGPPPNFHMPDVHTCTPKFLSFYLPRSTFHLCYPWSRYSAHLGHNPWCLHAVYAFSSAPLRQVWCLLPFLGMWVIPPSSFVLCLGILKVLPLFPCPPIGHHNFIYHSKPTGNMVPQSYM